MWWLFVRDALYYAAAPGLQGRHQRAAGVGTAARRSPLCRPRSEGRSRHLHIAHFRQNRSRGPILRAIPSLGFEDQKFCDCSKMEQSTKHVLIA